MTVTPEQEAQAWLDADDATHFGAHEKRLQRVVDRCEELKRQQAEAVAAAYEDAAEEALRENRRRLDLASIRIPAMASEIHDAILKRTPSDATAALEARDARVWDEAIEAAAKYHDDIFEHDSGGIQYSNAVGIPISNREYLEESCKRAHLDAKAIRALKKGTPDA